jgi:hypothetical protein
MDDETQPSAERAEHNADARSNDETKRKTRAGLSWPRAVFQSLVNWSVDFYPRLNAKRHRFPTNIATTARDLLLHRYVPRFVRQPVERWQLPEPDKLVIASLRSDDILADMDKAMKGWTGPIAAGEVVSVDAAKVVLETVVAQEQVTKAQFEKIRADAKAALEELTTPEMTLDDAIDLAKASLDEVKAQTEYQDQKATRLLTVTTFLSALSGALFASFSGNYPLRMADGLSVGWQAALYGAYGTFVLFVLAAVAGALVTFHATRTRFKYSKEATAKRQAGPTRSFLFFREMIGVSPQGWADSFVVAKDGKALLRPYLKEEYFKNYVAEAYLIAAKTADKLRYLGPAQSLLAWALRCLLVFVILMALIQANIPRQPVAPTEVKLIWPTRPVSADIQVTSVLAGTAGSPHPKAQQASETKAHVQVHGSQ